MARKIAKNERERYAFLSGANIGIGLYLVTMDNWFAKFIGVLNIIGSFVNIWDLWIKKTWNEWRDVLID